MDYQALAELLVPNVTMTPEELDSIFYGIDSNDFSLKI